LGLEPVRLSFLDGALKLSEAEVAALSPMTRLPALAAELLIVVGDAEPPEFLRQSKEFYDIWANAGNLLRICGCDHFTVLRALARPEGQVTTVLRTLIPARSNRELHRSLPH